MTGREIRTNDGQPREAFAIAGLRDAPDTWKLPHHRKSVLRAVRGKVDMEGTVDWEQMESAVSALMLARRRSLQVSPDEVLEAAFHLAGHYRMAGRPLPEILAALV